MPVPSKMQDLSTLAASNSPSGSDAIGNSLDDYIRSGFAIMRSTNAQSSASIASAATVDLGTSDGEAVTVTGTTTITSFGTSVPGLVREVTFSGVLTITNSSAIVLGGGVNYVTTAGDVMYFRSLGSGNWKQVTPPAFAYIPVNRSGDTMTGSLSVTGTVTAAANVVSTSGNFNGAAGSVTLQPGSSSGSLNLRPTFNSASGQAVLDNTGRLTLNPTIASASALTAVGQISIQSTGTNAALQVYDITNGGQVRIVAAGAANSKTLRVNTGGSFEIVNTAYSAVISNLTDAGVWTATNFIATSDSNKKTNVRKAEPRDFSELGHYTYTMTESGVKGRGPMAQEAEGTCDEYVYEGEDGTLGLDKAGIALEWVQNLARRLAALEEK